MGKLRRPMLFAQVFKCDSMLARWARGYPMFCHDVPPSSNCRQRPCREATSCAAADRQPSVRVCDRLRRCRWLFIDCLVFIISNSTCRRKIKSRRVLYYRHTMRLRSCDSYCYNLPTIRYIQFTNRLPICRPKLRQTTRNLRYNQRASERSRKVYVDSSGTR